ncbi:MAG: SCO family protein [Sphingobacteriaceae bacterium]|nr:SCO family protein [Sphingobacteriaceae bacterium]
MSNKSSFKKILILVTILALPGFLYYLLQEKGKNRYRPLGILGPKQVAATFHTKRGVKIPDTIYHRISEFKLLSNTGDSIGIPTDSNKIAIVNFFFSRCKTVCPEMNSQLARVVAEFPDNKRLKFYSISVDPAYDTPEVLNSYAKSLKANPKRWNFLTGDKNLIFKLAKEDFLIDALAPSHNADEIVHSPMLVLVDPDRKIRGYYDSTNDDQINKLIDEIKVLITEGLREATSLKPKK